MLIIFHTYSIIWVVEDINRQYSGIRKKSDRTAPDVAKKVKFLYAGGGNMRKSDARVRYTKRVLKESFLSLLRKKPVNKITVKEVCDLAEVNRATFYSHYSDCFDLKEKIEQEILKAFEQSLCLIEGFDVSALISAIYKIVEQHENACRVLIFLGASPSMPGRMINLAKDASITVWKRQLHNASDTELEMLYMHLSNGLMNVVLGGYDKYSRDDVVSFVNRIVKNSLSLFR